MRVDRLQREYDIEVRVVHFPLHPDTPADGMPLVEYFGGGPEAEERLRQGQERLRAMCAAEGLEYGERSMTWNSRLAQELGAWARSEGAGDAFDDAVFRAYFVDARNVSDPEVLVELAASAGLDPVEARRVLEERTFSAEIDEDWASSTAAGVTAIPTYEAGERRLVGAYPYEDLERMVVAAGARPRTER